MEQNNKISEYAVDAKDVITFSIPPVQIVFQSENERLDIKLKNNEDNIRLGRYFSTLLRKLKIEHDVVRISLNKKQ